MDDKYLGGRLRRSSDGTDVWGGMDTIAFLKGMGRREECSGEPTNDEATLRPLLE